MSHQYINKIPVIRPTSVRDLYTTAYTGFNTDYYGICIKLTPDNTVCRWAETREKAIYKMNELLDSIK